MSGPRVPLALVFDLDGTLVDSKDDIVDSVRFALAAHGRPPLDRERIASFVGDGARLLVARSLALPEADPGVDAVLQTFLERYATHAAERTTLMPGAREALAIPLPLALCTNKPRRATEAVLAALGLSTTFAVVVTGDDLPSRKPDPAVLHAVARRLDVPAATLVMVGDGPQDVACGKAAGARTVAVSGGFASDDMLRRSGPDVLVAGLSQLPATIALWRTGRQGS